MVTCVRSETTVFTSLANIQLWLTQNQGAEVELSGLRLQVGLPITAPRAVICTIWLLEKGGGSVPLVAGRLRGLINPRDGSVRLAFEGIAEVSGVARHLLDAIALDCDRAGELITA